MLSITSNRRKILILKKTNIFMMILSASMKSNCPGLVYPRQQRRIVTIATKPGERRLQLIPVLRLYRHHHWVQLCIIIRATVLQITIRKQRYTPFALDSHFKKEKSILVVKSRLKEKKLISFYRDQNTEHQFRCRVLISACETDSSQTATEYTSEHSNHGKHCHHKIEHIIKQHSEQNHSHDA